ncbi:MAG: precorrin-3B C(17)-methyltransferase [Alphaproteobacteria bacterium]
MAKAPAGTAARAPGDEVRANAALVVLTQGGFDLARRLKPALPRSTIHGPDGRVAGADVTFTDLAAHLEDLFTARVPIVGICAAGVLIRILAPLITEKREEGPVVALAEDGSAAVPLLGGHRGANGLARAIAALCGCTAAVTTAGDLSLGLALDDPPKGWRVANPECAKSVTAALLAGEAVRLDIEAGDGDWLLRSDAPFAAKGEFAVRLTDRDVPLSEQTLVLHPATLALGVGCARGAAPSELIRLARRALRQANLSPASVACVVSIELKEDEEAVHALARELNAPARFFSPERLEAEARRLANPSDAVFRETGCHGVAEGAALAATGPDGELVVAKLKSSEATCAIARASNVIDPSKAGRARGVLQVVGIGPGASAWLTPEARTALGEASDVVGYGLYLDLLGDLIVGKRRHASALGAEEERVRLALDLAAKGRTVALASSGDAGIYALAALVFELLESEDEAGWNRIRISVLPGISAMQAAAARAGAPLGHDFCAISLSDLLTPWAEIEDKLKAAARGDFVIALYNPASTQRKRQIAAARDILLGSRGPDTPVLLARNLGREGEEVKTIRLGELGPQHADMTTVVLVGSSRTRLVSRGQARWLYTPRGYTLRGARQTDRASGKRAS